MFPGLNLARLFRARASPHPHSAARSEIDRNAHVRIPQQTRKSSRWVRATATREISKFSNRWEEPHHDSPERPLATAFPSNNYRRSSRIDG